MVVINFLEKYRNLVTAETGQIKSRHSLVEKGLETRCRNLPVEAVFSEEGL